MRSSPSRSRPPTCRATCTPAPNTARTSSTSSPCERSPPPDKWGQTPISLIRGFSIGEPKNRELEKLESDPINRVQELLAGASYVADRRLATATFLALE